MLIRECKKINKSKFFNLRFVIDEDPINQQIFIRLCGLVKVSSSENSYFYFFSSFLHLDFLSNQTEDITLASEILNQPSIKILGNEKPHQRKNKQTAINPKIKQSKKKKT